MRKRFSCILTVLVFVTAFFCFTSSYAAETKKEQVVLYVTVRDFNADGVLFEGEQKSCKLLAESTLGNDNKPVFDLSFWQNTYGDAVTQKMLDSFFNYSNGYNMEIKKSITLNADEKGSYVINSATDDMDYTSGGGFFPIDNALFGNEDRTHNYHFSVELHATFKYKKGDTFSFTGDDDLWVYFNNALCVDLGGVHQAQSASVSIDELVANGTLNINEGDFVSFDMFYMERHTTESNLCVKTNIDFVNFNTSDSAIHDVLSSYKNGIVPQELMKLDLTDDATVEQFAAIAVKYCEAMKCKSGAKTDIDVGIDFFSKAEVLGIIDKSLEKDRPLTRETAAEMLVYAYKAAVFPEWKRENDSQYMLSYPEVKCNDSTEVSAEKLNDVLFIMSNNIMQTDERNCFLPKQIMKIEEALSAADKACNITLTPSLIPGTSLSKQDVSDDFSGIKMIYAIIIIAVFAAAAVILIIKKKRK